LIQATLKVFNLNVHILKHIHLIPVSFISMFLSNYSNVKPETNSGSGMAFLFISTQLKVKAV